MSEAALKEFMIDYSNPFAKYLLNISDGRTGLSRIEDLMPLSDDSGKDLRRAGETRSLIQYREAEMREHSWVKAFLLILMIVEGAMVSSAISDATNASKVSAEIILNQLNGSKPVIYDGVEIIGDLDLSSSPFELENKVQKSINSSLIITNSTFRGGIYSRQSMIMKPMKIEGCIIEGDVRLQNVSFLDLAGFNSTSFQKEACFSQSNFSGGTHFRGCTFQAEGDISGSTFMSGANFDEAKFDAARFTDCQFQGYSRFGKAIFQQSADFEGSEFFYGASFNQAQFHGRAFLGRTNFHGKTYFTQSNFRDSASFSESNFGDTYFNKANFAEEVDFLNSSFVGDVSFAGARFQKDALFYKATFSSNINLHSCTYSNLVLHWNSIRNRIKPEETIYKDLIENYKGLFWISDVNGCYFDFRHWKQSTKPWTDITKIPDIFLELYCGYGTKPLNTLFWIGLFVLLFGICYWLKGGINKIVKPARGERIKLVAKNVSDCTYDIEYTPEVIYEKSSRLRSLFYSLKFSLYVMASKNVEDLKVNKNINGWIVVVERWLGRGLFVIFMYYVGSLVTSYFTPHP